MRNDLDLQKDVQGAIKWDVKLKSAKISVLAEDGLIILSGTVNNYSDKLRAEKVAKSVIGVKGMSRQKAICVSQA